MAQQATQQDSTAIVQKAASASPPEPMAIRIAGRELVVNAGASKVMLERNDDGSWGIKEIATLGASDVFVRRDASGTVKLAYKKVRLFKANQEIAKVGKVWIPTVPGYNKCNQIASINPITPPTMWIAGVEQENPYIDYFNTGLRTGTIRRAISRKIGIGYGPTGNLVAIDVVRHFNFDAYYMETLLGKVAGKKKKWTEEGGEDKDSAPEGPNEYARFGSAMVCELNSALDVKRRMGQVFAFDEATHKVYHFLPVRDMIGIWIDPTHVEIQAAHENHVRQQKHGDTIVQNVCWRNVLKQHPAIATATLKVFIPKIEGDIKNKWQAQDQAWGEILVYGYRHDMDRQEYQDLANKIVKGEEVTNVEIQRDEAEAEVAEVADVSDTEREESMSPGVTDRKMFDDEGDQRPIEELAAELAVSAKEKEVDTEEISKRLFQTRVRNLTQAQMKRLKSVVDSMDAKRKPEGGEGKVKP